MPKETLKENHNAIDITLHAPHPPKWEGNRKVALLYRGALTCPFFVTTPTPAEGKTKTMFCKNPDSVEILEWYKTRFKCIRNKIQTHQK